MGKPGSPARRGNDSSSSLASKPAADALQFDSSIHDGLAESLSVESTVVSRETATHLAFGKSRREDFVFAETEHYMRILTEFCQWDRDVSQQQKSSSVLVVVGRAGTGKSALLANWADQHRRYYQSRSAQPDGSRGAFGSGTGAVNELVYEHYAGCSYDSVKLSLFLFRFMHQIKISYGLRDFELPREHEEEKLKFSLARCLEAAVGKSGDHSSGPSSQRKRIILVLDGIDCIRTSDGSDSLSWLPNLLPPGVRIIVSATLATTDKRGRLQCCKSILRKPAAVDEDGDLVFDLSLKARDHDSRTIRELRRRNAQFLEVEPLDESTCTAIIELHEAKFGRMLLPEEKQLIISARGSANPLFVRLLLSTLEHSFDDNEHKQQRHRWLQLAADANDLHTVFEMMLKRWNEILLADLFAELNRCHTTLEANAAASAMDPAHPRALRRAPSKLTVSAADAGYANGSTSKGGGMNNNDINDNIRQAPPKLFKQKSGSMLGPANASAQAESAELEGIQTAIEQRALLVRHVLSLLAVTRYGLSVADLANLIGGTVNRTVVDQLLTLLRPHLMEIRRYDCGAGGGASFAALTTSGTTHGVPSNNSEGRDAIVLYDLSHNQLRRITRFGFLHDQQLRATYYRGLATYFGNMDACQRRIDELPVQLERCAMWSVLQSSLVNIKMFQLWWSKRNRQEFFTHWLELASNSSAHDPVDDFIRSLDDFIIHENPSAEQLLALFMTVTAFLRAWQKVSAGAATTSTTVAGAVLNRPKPPQLQEFITSLVSFTTAHLPEREAYRIQHEIAALCTHSDDGYNVQRWLWTQFPLIGIAFECRVVRGASSSSSKATPSTTSKASSDASTSGETLDLKTTKRTGKAASTTPSSTDTSSQSLGAAQSSTSATTSKSGVSLPPTSSVSSEPTSGSVTKKHTVGKRKVPAVSARRALALSLDSASALDSDDVCGAFEFLSPDGGDGRLSSISKIEIQLVELRAKHDKLKFALREKQETLQALESRVLDARDQAHAADQNASRTDELMEQMRRVGDETAVGRQRGDYYRAILRHCEVNPARDPNIIESAEAVVHKLRQEIVELQQRAQVMSYETRLASSELPKLRQATQDKAAIHLAAIDRLRWRRELQLRMASRSRDAPRSLTKSKRSNVGGTSDGEAGPDQGHESDSEQQQCQQVARSSDSELVASHTGTAGPAARTDSEIVVDANFVRAKERLLHMKETSLARQRNTATLQTYLGSAYKDDGVLGALRHVGINHPEEVQMYWQSQLDHAGQLEEEGKQAESRVAELRDRLRSLQTQFVNLKLGGGTSPRQEDDAPTTHVGSPISETPVTDAGALAPPRVTMKELEQQIADASTVNQQRRERVAWMRALHEKLQLGLLHIAQVLGATSTTASAAELDLLGLVDAIEQGVRHVLGDETHLQSTSSASMRRKNSVRVTNVYTVAGTNATGSSAGSLTGTGAALVSAVTGPVSAATSLLSHAARTDDDRVRYNIRVSLSPQRRQMNPYVVDELSELRREENDDEEDADDDGEEDDDNNNRVGSAKTTSSRRAAAGTDRPEGAVKRRSDIKNSSRLEIEKKKAAQRPKSKKKSASASAAAAE